MSSNGFHFDWPIKIMSLNGIKWLSSGHYNRVWNIDLMGRMVIKQSMPFKCEWNMNFSEWIDNSLKGVQEYENWIKVIPFKFYQILQKYSQLKFENWISYVIAWLLHTTWLSNAIDGLKILYYFKLRYILINLQSTT